MKINLSSSIALPTKSKFADSNLSYYLTSCLVALNVLEGKSLMLDIFKMVFIELINYLLQVLANQQGSWVQQQHVQQETH